jgi:hypothetical protein
VLLERIHYLTARENCSEQSVNVVYDLDNPFSHFLIASHVQFFQAGEPEAVL